eukprot:g2020.t1
MADDTEHPAVKQWAGQIDLDMARFSSFQSDIHPSVYQTLCRQTRQLLLAFCVHNPEIGYTQGMDRIAALLLSQLTPEDAFAGLRLVVEGLFADYFKASGIDLEADTAALEAQVEARVPRVLKKLRELDVPMLSFTSRWFVVGYIDRTDTETCVKIWDCLLAYSRDGPSARLAILIAVALAMFRLGEAELLGCEDMEDVENTIQRILEDQVRADAKRFGRCVQEELERVLRELDAA